VSPTHTFEAVLREKRLHIEIRVRSPLLYHRCAQLKTVQSGDFIRISVGVRSDLSKHLIRRYSRGEMHICV
jgi:hypothetical protein